MQEIEPSIQQTTPVAVAVAFLSETDEMLRDEMLTHLASTLNTFMQQQCKEWQVRKGELFKRTKELGYENHYAKQLLESWGDWWRNNSEEDEEEDEEEEEEMEEENQSPARLHQLMQWNMTGKMRKKKPRKRRCYQQLQ
jgi:hypothetical protein